MKICIISTHAPYGTSLSRDAIETLLVTASYGFDATLLVMGDGVLQLLADQDPTAIAQKSTASLLQAAKMYGVERLLVCREDLHERGLSQEDLIDSLQFVAREQIASLVREHHRVLAF